jgi:type I restriction enzyme, S subunit
MDWAKAMSDIDQSMLPIGWNNIRLGDIVSLRGGLSYKGELISNVGNSLVTMGCVSSKDRFKISGLKRYRGTYTDVHTLFAGDIVIATRDVTQNREIIGSPALIPAGLPGDAVIAATNLYKVKNLTDVPNEFIYWVMRTAAYRNHIIASAKGTTVVMLTKDAVENYYFPLPPPKEQRAIASILGAIDGKIGLNLRMNETLEAMARAIFKDWFIDFGPTRAKMEARSQYLASEIWSLFSDRLDDDEEKPTKWELGTLDYYANLNPESWSRANYPTLINYVDLSGTKWGTIESINSLDREHAPSRAQKVLRPGDTIVGTVRPGNGSYAFVNEDGLTGSTGFAVLRPKQRDAREFVYLAATSPENIDRLAHLADGAAYPAVRPEVVAATEVVIAPQPVMKAFTAAAGPLFDRIDANKLESRALAAMRDLLFPKLMSGEIHVKDAAKVLEAAL